VADFTKIEFNPDDDYTSWDVAKIRLTLPPGSYILDHQFNITCTGTMVIERFDHNKKVEDESNL